MKRAFLALVAVLVSPAVSAKPFRVAAIYPNHMVGHYNCTCGMEGACITEAAIKRAREEGLNVAFTLVNKDWNVFKTLAAAESVAARHFDAAVGTLISQDAIVTGEVLEAAGIPFIVPTATNPKVTAGRHLVTRISFNDYRQAALLARLALKELGSKKIAVIRNISGPYSDFLGKQFVVEARKLDSKVEIAEFPIIEGFTNFKGLLTKILAVNPDLLFTPISQGDIASIYVNLVGRGSKLTLLSSDTIEGKPKFLDANAPLSDKIRFIYPKHWNGRFEGPEAARYLSLHRAHCKQYEPSMTTMAAYDAVELLLRVLKKNPNARGAELVRLIRETPYHGMTGPLRYGKDGDPVKPIELFELKGRDVVHWRRYE